MVADGLGKLELDHYLEAMVRKPGSLRGATALAQAHSAGKFARSTTPGGQRPARPTAIRRHLRADRGLLLHRDLARDHVVAGLAAALRAGALTAGTVALEARKAAELDDPVTGGASAGFGTPE